MSKTKIVAWGWILLILIISVSTAPILKKLNFGYQLDDFFSDNDSAYHYYQEHKVQYGIENNFLMLGIERSRSVFDTTFILKLKDLSLRLKDVSSVKEIFSPATARRQLNVPLFGALSEPLLHTGETKELQKDKERIYQMEDRYRHLFSDDANSVLIYILLKDSLDRKNRTSLLAEIDQEIQSTAFDSSTKIHIAGQARTQLYYVRTLEKEMLMFGCLGIVFLIVFLYLTYRTLFSVVVPIFILMVSLSLTLGLALALLGELDFMMTMLPMLIFVTGNVSIIHLFASYLEAQRDRQTKEEAISTMIRQSGRSTLISSLTTAIGFFSLYFLPIQPIQNFGIFAGLGILLTWGVTLLLLPSFLKISNGTISKREASSFWKPLMESIFQSLKTHRFKYVLGIFLLVLLSIWGACNIENNSFFLEDLDQKSPLSQDMKFFEQNFAGIRPFEIGVELKNDKSSGFSLDDLQQLDSFSQFLKDSCKVGMLTSGLSLVKEARRYLHAGRDSYYGLPESEEEWTEIKELLKSEKLIELNRTWFGDLPGQMRMSGKIKDYGSTYNQSTNRLILDYALKLTSMNIRITGAAHLMERANLSISSGLLLGLGVSLFLVTVIMSFLLKSFRLAALALVPNIIPLLIIAGIMGWMGVDMKLGTALIFTVIFGIAVDDTVHFLLHYQRSLMADATHALEHTFTNLGKTLVITSFILSAGFLAFTLSEFNSTFYAGLLITIALILALLADLIVLPVLIEYSERKIFNRKKM